MSYPAPLGHDAALRTLGRLRTHALLFTGPEAVGRRQAARWYAALLNCLAPGDGQPCGRCDSCRLQLADDHPDYREVGPSDTTSTGRLSRRPEIRIGQLTPREGQEGEPLGRWLETRPRFRRRVGVIDRAETLNANAANAFLKVLEEPPSYAVVILIAPSREAVLPTLASRCTGLRFGAVDADVLPESYRELAPHPGLRLGRIGALQRAAENREAFDALRDAVESYVRALPADLEAALEATEGLEKAWLGREGGGERAGVEPAELLRERLRALPAPLHALADDLIASAEEALAAYAAAGPVLQRLTLELRAVLRRHAVREV